MRNSRYRKLVMAMRKPINKYSPQSDTLLGLFAHISAAHWSGNISSATLIEWNFICTTSENHQCREAPCGDFSQQRLKDSCSSLSHRELFRYEVKYAGILSHSKPLADFRWIAMSGSSRACFQVSFRLLQIIFYEPALRNDPSKWETLGAKNFNWTSSSVHPIN